MEAEDAQLLERLRVKYSREAPDVSKGADQCVATQSGGVDEAALASARACAACAGVGRVTEEYNNRVLELRREVERVDTRLEGYKQELAALEEELAAGTGGAEGVMLRRQVADGIEAQMERLQRAHAARLQALA